MKTITVRERELILDLAGEGLTPLPAGVLEKDILITEVLLAITQMDTYGSTLVFCGGTCLSKAHCLLERMSEDMDFKVVIPEGLSRNAHSKQLRTIKKELSNIFIQMGFHVPVEEVVARDENSYISMNLHYKSQFPLVASLRTEIKIELSARAPLLPTQMLPVRSILDSLVRPAASGFSVACIGVLETLAEKVLSFLRRTAEVRSGRNRAAPDDRLVRHLYDVLRIARQYPNVMDNLPYTHFRSMVLADAAQYRNQYPEFEREPVHLMRGVLTALQEESGFESDYVKFLNELVFGEAVPYSEARANFIKLAESLLMHCDCKQD